MASPLAAPPVANCSSNVHGCSSRHRTVLDAALFAAGCSFLRQVIDLVAHTTAGSSKPPRFQHELAAAVAGCSLAMATGAPWLWRPWRGRTSSCWRRRTRRRVCPWLRTAMERDASRVVDPQEAHRVADGHGDELASWLRVDGEEDAAGWIGIRISIEWIRRRESRVVPGPQQPRV